MSGNAKRRQLHVLRTVVTTAALIGGVLAIPLAAPAGATTATVAVGQCDDTETGLQAALDNEAVDVIDLAEGLVCSGNYQLGLSNDPPGRPILIEGLGTGATFDGDGNHQLRLVNVGASTVRNLTFTGGDYTGSGAGVKVQGSSAPTFDHVTFTGNEVGGEGGALAVKTQGATGTTTIRNSTFRDNRAGTGGGLYVDTTTDIVLTDNVFTGNVANYQGGGAALSTYGDRTITITGNSFDANDVLVPGCLSGSVYGGGGLAITGAPERFVSAAAVSDGLPDVVQARNTFTGNTVDRDDCEQTTISADEISYGDYYGGGEWVRNAPTSSRDDQFVGNTVRNVIDTPSQQGFGEAEGGGLAVQSTLPAALPVDAQNLVLAHNEATGYGIGGGAYFGSDGVDVTLLHATVVANHATQTGGGLSGSDSEQDDLTLQNSIVYGNTAEGDGETGGEDDLDLFRTVTANFSDVCETEAQPFEAGSANNLCVDPGLVAPSTGDVHQKATSPTLDRASAALTGSLDKDYEGQARVQDAGGDGPTPAAPDMGADELPAPPPPPPAPEPEPEVKANLIAPGSIGEDDGYCLAAKDGGVFTFGGCQFFGAADRGDRVRATATDITAPQSLVKLNAPVVSIAMIPADTGYWQAAADGGVFTFGTAKFYGSMGNIPLTKPIVGIASSPTGLGYWLVASDGGIFTFGDAPFLGSMGGTPLTKPIVGITATPSGNGYWLVASDGGVFSFGDAQFFGSAGGTKLNSPVVGMGSRPGGLGYWLATADGDVLPYGDAPFLGNRVGQPLNAPVIGIKSAASGLGYWLIAGDGGVFSYGTAPFLGSMGARVLNQPVIDMTG